MTPTWVSTECGVDQVSLLVNAGHSSVAQTVATLLFFPVTHPALQGPWSWRIREDASRPVPMGLRQKLITETSLCFLQLVQLLIQAMLLLFTATWVEDGQNNGKLLCTGWVINAVWIGLEAQSLSKKYSKLEQWKKCAVKNKDLWQIKYILNNKSNTNVQNWENKTWKFTSLSSNTLPKYKQKICPKKTNKCEYTCSFDYQNILICPFFGTHCGGETPNTVL